MTATILALGIFPPPMLAGAQATATLNRRPATGNAQGAQVVDASVSITSSAYWVDGFGYLNVVGDVLNGTALRQAPTVKIRLMGGSGQQLGTTISVKPYAWPISAGARSPFAYYEAAPAGFDHAELTLSSAPWAGGPMDGALAVVADPPRVDVGGDAVYGGTLRNDSAFAISEWDVSVGLYDSGGSLFNAWHDYHATTLSPGASATFRIVVPDHYAGASTRLYQAEGVSADYGAVAVSWNNYFDDIGSTSFRRDIVWLAESGITGGCAAGRFCPADGLSRGQMAAFLDRALHLPPTATDFFTDDDASIFEASINRLAESGITGGCAAGRFCPAEGLSRGQMAAFLRRALE
jgi:hypothetical protein